MDFVLSMLVYFCLFFIFVFLFTVHLLVAMCTLIMMGKKKKFSNHYAEQCFHVLWHIKNCFCWHVNNCSFKLFFKNKK